ncbi:MAG: hypothetical protein VX519_06815 [Myxococcota bacterium]|nr:hypothetical protein [Myxococcota bacterium]
MSTQNCPNCSAEVQFDARFCVSCGTSLSDTSNADEPSVLDSPEVDESIEATSDTAPAPPDDTGPPALTPPPPPTDEPGDSTEEPTATAELPGPPPSEALVPPPPSDPPSKPNLDVGYIFGHAWAKFQERPGLCIGAWVIFTMISGASGAGGGGGGGSGDSDIDATLAIIAIVFGILFSCAAFLVAGPIRGGYDLAMVRHSAGDNSVQFGDIFSGFNKFLNLFLSNLLYSLTVFIGFCFLLIPGIIAGLTLWPVFLLVMEDDLDPIQALKAAWELTSPHLGALFVLGLATCAINIVGLLACCIGLLVSGPVSQLVWATVYRELRGR